MNYDTDDSREFASTTVTVAIARPLLLLALYDWETTRRRDPEVKLERTEWLHHTVEPHYFIHRYNFISYSTQ